MPPSKNLSGDADNPQERLSTTQRWKAFLGGFIEGEGSFCISIKKNKTSKYGFNVDTEFFLYQREERKEILEKAKKFFGSGRIYPKAGNEKVLVFEIADNKVLHEKVIPFLEKYFLPFSARKKDFLLFKEAVRMKAKKEHLKREGLLKLVDIAYEINQSGKQRKRKKEEVVERILRGHTPG